MDDGFMPPLTINSHHRPDAFESIGCNAIYLRDHVGGNKDEWIYVCSRIDDFSLSKGAGVYGYSISTDGWLSISKYPSEFEENILYNHTFSINTTTNQLYIFDCNNFGILDLDSLTWTISTSYTDDRALNNAISIYVPISNTIHIYGNNIDRSYHLMLDCDKNTTLQMNINGIYTDWMELNGLNNNIALKNYRMVYIECMNSLMIFGGNRLNRKRKKKKNKSKQNKKINYNQHDPKSIWVCNLNIDKSSMDDTNNMDYEWILFDEPLPDLCSKIFHVLVAFDLIVFLFDDTKMIWCLDLLTKRFYISTYVYPSRLTGNTWNIVRDNNIAHFIEPNVQYNYYSTYHHHLSLDLEQLLSDELKIEHKKKCYLIFHGYLRETKNTIIPLELVQMVGYFYFVFNIPKDG